MRCMVPSGECVCVIFIFFRPLRKDGRRVFTRFQPWSTDHPSAEISHADNRREIRARFRKSDPETRVLPSAPKTILAGRFKMIFRASLVAETRFGST